MKFGVRYDRTTQIVTAIVVAVLAVVAIGTRSAWMSGLAVAIIAAGWAWSTRGYAVEDGVLIVRLPIRKVRLALDATCDIRLATEEDLRGSLRLFGSGGFFGYYGLYRTASLGRCDWYVTDRSRMVVLKSAGRTLVLSPADPESFIDAVVRAAKREPVAPPAAWRGWIVPAGAIPIAAAAIAFAFLYSPGAPGVTLAHDGLSIHDRFYPVTIKASDVDIPNIRVVDLASSAEWRPVWRTNGFANSHYRAGWFRLRNGQTARLYQAGSGRLVLLPPKGSGNPVLLQAGDPDRFIAQVRTAWSGGS